MRSWVTRALCILVISPIAYADLSNLGEETCTSLWFDADEPALVQYSIKTYKLRDVYELAQDNPDMLLNAFQHYGRMIMSQRWENGQPYKDVLEPTYRARKVRVWKAFSGSDESAGRMLVDQYDAIDEVTQFVLTGMHGGKIGQAKTIVGPPGTGKTELLYILDLMDAYKSTHSDGFHRYAFRWKNLSRIPSLRNALMIDQDGRENLINPGLENAPVLGLFSPSLQAKLIEAGSEKIRKELGTLPRPYGKLDSINQEILDHILRFQLQERGMEDSSRLTQGQYMAMLEPFVEIYRYLPTANRDDRVIAYLGDNPNFGELIMDINPVLAPFFPNSSLAVKYGKIPRASGGGLFIDEAYRNNEDTQNTMLNVTQNQEIAYGGSPSFKGDWLVLYATNDESVGKAVSNSQTGMGASVDRTDTVPMRQPIHPLQAAKVAILLAGASNFWMKDLRKPNSPWVPADVNELITLPDEKGKILGPEGRYAIKYSADSPDSPRAVFVAPRALTYLGLIAAATRLVTNYNKLQEHKNELALATLNQQFVTDPDKRMQVILGELQVEDKIAQELDRIRNLFEEGSQGITARDTERWMRLAFSVAADRFRDEPTLTPAVILESFQRGLTTKKLQPKGKQSKADWVMLQKLMTQKFLKLWLAEDLRTIQSGDASRVQKVYDDVAAEIVQLSSFSYDNEGQTPTGDQVNINYERYQKIRAIWERQNNGNPLRLTKVSNEHLKAAAKQNIYGPLYRAVQEFLMSLDLQGNASSRLQDYFSGQTNLPADVIEEGQRAETSMAAFGYNKPAIQDALKMMQDITREEAAMKR